MLKMLKFDFYKIIKSKMLLAFLIVTLCTVFFGPIAFYVVNKSDESVYWSLYHSGAPLSTVLFIFAVPFAVKDFSSKYMKNLTPAYSLKDEICYILSKIFYIAVFCIIYMLLNFVIEIIFNYACGIGCMYDAVKNAEDFSIKEVWLQILWDTVNSIAIGTFLLFLCVLVKKEYIALLIVVPYIFFLKSFIYDAINSIVGGNFEIANYTLFGAYYDFNGIKELTRLIVVSVIYFVVFAVGSCLLFARRSLINGAYNRKRVK